MRDSRMPQVTELEHALSPIVTPAEALLRVPGKAVAATHGVRPLKVMHVTNSMSLGGTEKVVLRVATQLTEGFEHSVWCMRSFDPELVAGYLSPEQFRALNFTPSRFAIFVPKLVQAIRAAKPDVIHSRNWGAIEAAIAGRLAGVPVVIHSEHGYEVESLSKTPRRQQWMRRFVCSTADAFLTVSRELRDFHAEQAGVDRNRIRVIYNGVDTVRFAPNEPARAMSRAALDIAPDDFVAGAVGRIVPIKDYTTLLQATSVLATKIPNFKLMIVGDGPELRGLTALAESLGVRERLLLPGRRDDIPDLLAAMDVFVQASLREGMSNTLLEAMSTGLPAVVTRVGGNPEVVHEGRTGWMFAPGEVESLSQLLLQLANDHNLRTAAGQAARLRIQQIFSNQTMLDNYRTLYLELAHKRKVNLGANSVTGNLRTEENTIA